MLSKNTNKYETAQNTGMRARQSDNHLSRFAARQRELEAELAALRKANRGKPDRKQWHTPTPVIQEDEGWFTTYLDVMTLLLVLLVVMLSYSGKNPVGILKQAPSDTPAMIALIPPISDLPAISLSPIPAIIGLLPASNGLLPQIGLHHEYRAAPENDSPPPDVGTQPKAAALAANSEVPDVAQAPTITPADPEVAALPDSPTTPDPEPAAPTQVAVPAPDHPSPALDAQDMLAGLPLGELGKDIDVIVNERSISFRINSEILFGSGQADLSLEGLAVLKRLVSVFNSVKYQITIEGHTDSVPMLHNRRYPSNWELSGARAGSVVRYLVANGVASSRLRAIGNADTRPLASNSTPQGRANNRRVELVMERREN